MLRTWGVWALFASTLFLSSCGGISEEGYAPIATEVAANIYATQTATRPTEPLSSGLNSCAREATMLCGGTGMA